MDALRMTIGRVCFASGLVLGMATTCTAQAFAGESPVEERPIVERYQLNAQYRGGIKKGFPEIGSGNVSFHRLGEREFRVRLKGSVEHPDNHQIYSLELSMWFRLEGATVVDVRDDNRYNERAEEYRERVERMIPFIYLVKFLPVPVAGDEPSRRYRYRGKEYSIRYVRTRNRIEATVYERDDVVAKFFILPSPRDVPLLFEKFRVPAEQDLMLSFVREVE